MNPENRPEELFFVFDTETDGYHGKTFAVGWVVVNRRGEVKGEGLLSTDQYKIQSKWVKDNILSHLKLEHRMPLGFRNDFWKQWNKWRKEGALTWAWFQWPCESNFLTECVNDLHFEREWNNPAPVHEIATVMKLAKMGSQHSYPDLPSELPTHNPLCDARKSARLLLEALDRLGL